MKKPANNSRSEAETDRLANARLPEGRLKGVNHTMKKNYGSSDSMSTRKTSPLPWPKAVVVKLATTVRSPTTCTPWNESCQTAQGALRGRTARLLRSRPDWLCAGAPAGFTAAHGWHPTHAARGAMAEETGSASGAILDFPGKRKAFIIRRPKFQFLRRRHWNAIGRSA